MSSYLPPSSPHRQPSTASTASNYSFPSSRSTTVTSTTSLSSRFTDRSGEGSDELPAPTRKHSASLGAGGGLLPSAGAVSSMLSQFESAANPASKDPPPKALAPAPTLNATIRSSPLAAHHARGKSVPAVTSNPLTSPTSSPRPGPSPYNGANRNSVITGTTSLNKDDITHLRSSSVSHFRTLSKLTDEGTAADFKIDTEKDVAGMAGRKRLSRVKTDNMSSWERMTWMDKRRQLFQAYEYLCHIGEAKEWMEDCIGETIPPIIELEEALRDGVTLAKLTQVFAPELVPRIFEHPKLQWRHSENINRFFSFLKKVELPDIFIFETTDLYNKKNIPKVIYCIHALSFLLFRLGLTSHVIGNLVGKLEFTEQEIQNTQKGLDKAGVTLPSFGGINKHFEIEPEPEPEPVESEEERIERELHEVEDAIIKLQQMCRGALVRWRLADMWGDLEDDEHALIQLQARIRGMFARTSYAYQAQRAQWATKVQSAARGFLARKRMEARVENLEASQDVFTRLQAKIRGNAVRNAKKQQRARVERASTGITRLQAAARGFLLRQQMTAEVKEVHNSEQGVVSLQARARGYLLRQKLADKMDAVHSSEEGVVSLQAAARGFLLRQKLADKMDAVHSSEDSIVAIQAAARGMLARRRKAAQVDKLTEDKDHTVRLQAGIRGLLVRKEVRATKDALAQQEETITTLQAIARAGLVRRTVEATNNALAAQEELVIQLQAAARGVLVRKGMVVQKEQLEDADDEDLPRLQAHVRGLLERRRFETLKKDLAEHTDLWTEIQAYSRGTLVRWDYRFKIASLFEAEEEIIDLQACARGMLVREAVNDMLDALYDETPSITLLQAHCRGALLREFISRDLDALEDEVESIIDLQAHIRGFLHRLRRARFLAELEYEEDSIIAIQAAIRGAMKRVELDDLVLAIQDEEEAIIDLQARARGVIQRKQYQARLKHYNDNMAKVIKIQSFVRAKQQGEAYKSLMSGKNPPVGTVKNFVHLLNDSDFDFDQEIEFEALRKKVVQHVRANEMAETYVDQLDVKIALLVKNKITLDEVIKHQKRFTGHVGNLLSNSDIASSDPFDLKALNNNSRKRLERYQQMFYALQTKPQYLSRLFKRIREQNAPDKEMKRIENLVMGLFGYSQKRREEYYLLKLIVKSIEDEVEKCHRPDDFLRTHFFWVKIVANYVRSPRDRKFLRELLGPLIKEEIIDNEELDLESDPMQIYKASINNEELRTGMRSRRDPEIGRELAIKDPETRETFIEHLQALRSLSDDVISVLEDNVHKMPYGIRYIAQRSIAALCARFPDEGPGAIHQIVEHFIYQKYFHPAIVTPDLFGIIGKGKITPLQKRNLGELDKILNQITSGRLFAFENVFLQPLNEYVSVATARFKEVFHAMVTVPPIDARFEMNDYEDLTSVQRPTLYIKMSDIFAIHQLVATEIDSIADGPQDHLRELVRELGSVQNSESDLRNVKNTEITLQLDPSANPIEDKDADLKALMVETKRCILYIIRVQTGSNLMEILLKPITDEDLEKWDTLLKEERANAGGKKRGAYADHSALNNIDQMSYAELKATALNNIIELEKKGKLSRNNHFQDLLNEIAHDIRTKHRRRVQRSREMEGVEQTLAHLQEKSRYLDAQLQSYNDYIEQAMVTLQTKKGKKRAILPFTRQYFHMRELKQSGRVPKFGSYKYTARGLADKGVLVKMDMFPEKRWDKVNFTISSDEVGVFFVEATNGSMMIPGASAQVLLDDLLQMQFYNNMFMTVWDGVRFNVNLFLHLLFRKFYRDE